MVLTSLKLNIILFLVSKLSRRKQNEEYGTAIKMSSGYSLKFN